MPALAPSHKERHPFQPKKSLSLASLEPRASHVASSFRWCVIRLRRSSKIALWRASGEGRRGRVRVGVSIASFDSHDWEVAVFDRTGLCIWDWPGNDGAGIRSDSISVRDGDTHLRTDSRRTSMGTSAVMRRLVRMAIAGIVTNVFGVWTSNL